MVDVVNDPSQNGQPETYKIFKSWNPGQKKVDGPPAPQVKTFSMPQVGGPSPSKASPYDLDYYGAALGIPQEELKPYLDAGITSQLEAQSDVKLESAKQELVSDAIAEQSAVEDFVEIGEEIRARSSLKRFISSGHLAMLVSGDPIVKNNAVRHFETIFAFEDLINKRVQAAEDDAGFTTDGDFIDLLGTAVIGVFSNELYQERERLVKQTEDLIYNPALTLDQKEEEFDNILQRAADQGLFTNVNRYYLSDFLELAYAGTESSEAKWQEFWGKFDVVAGLVPGSPVGAALVRGGKSARTAVRLTKGVSALRGTTTLSSAGIVASALVSSAAASTYRVATSPLRALGWATQNPGFVAAHMSRNLPIPEFQHNILTEMFPGIITPDSIRPATLSHTSKAGMYLFEQNNEVAEITQKVLRDRGFGMTDDKVKELELALLADSTAVHNSSGSRKFLDGGVKMTPMGDVVYYEVFVDDVGMAFNGPSGRIAAQNLADSLPVEAHVVEWEKADQWAVVTTKNVPTEITDMSAEQLMKWAATPIDELGEGWVAQHIRAKTLVTSESNKASVLRAEATLDKWAKINNDLIEEAWRLNTKAQVGEVAAIFNEYNFGRWAHRKEAPGTNAFKLDFYVIHGKFPTPEQTFLYARAQSLQDMESFLLADEAFKWRVNEGVVILDNKYQVIPASVNDIAPGESVLDVRTGDIVPASSLPPGVTIYKSGYPEQSIFGKPAEYVFAPELKTRRLYHSDIVSRNAGGHRVYRQGEFSFFVKQETTYKTISGSEKVGLPRTVAGAKTIQEAQAFEDQLNAIVTYFKTRLPAGFKNSDVRTLVGDAQADLIVAQNSKWYPTANTVEKLLDWADETGANLGKEFQFVEHGQQLKDAVGAFAHLTYGDALNLTRMDPKARKVARLRGYGGNEGRTLDPFQAMQKTHGETIANQAYRQYMARAVNGLMRAAVESGALQNAAELKGRTLTQKLHEAKFRGADSPGVGQRLELERQRIIGHLDRRSFGDATWAKIADSISNYLYGKGFKEWSYKAGDMRSKNPLVALRTFAFDAKLGFLTPSQLYVQASQAKNVMAVGGMNGVKGTALYLPFRYALANGNPTVVKAFGDLFGPIVGLTGDQFVQMVDLFRVSGRDMIGASLAEFGTDAITAGGAVGRTYKSVAGKTRFFFNEGELVARISAWNTAYIEYLAKFPGKNPARQHGMDWIMSRQDTLTQSMTSQSRTWVEKLPMTQFLSYQFRINEAIFAGTKSLGLKGKPVLTPAEKFRLAVTETILLGASGWGVAATAMDYYKYRYGTDMDEEVYGMVRRGALDYLLSEMSGVDTALSSRLGSGDNLFQMMRDLNENNVFELVGGPSGEVAIEALMVSMGAARSLAKGVTSGDFEDFGESMIRFGRVFSTGNAAYNAYMAATVGQYLSRNNTLIADELTDMEPLFLSLGVPLERVEEAFKFNNMQKIEKLFMSTTINQIQKEYNKANAELTRGDFDAFSETMRGISLMYNSRSPFEQNLIDAQIKKTRGSIEDKSILAALKYSMGRDLGAE